MISLPQAIKAEARRLGFQLVGVTTPNPPPHLDVYARWLEAGRHGEMAYLASERARQRRADPLSILPDCRSILVLGVRYHAPQQERQNQGEQGRVAAYAWGDDYHQVLPERLQALETFIEERVGHTVLNRWYTDTGPLLERELAQRAGLGWIGKNTCLIHPRLGSYFLLAEILLTLELDIDTPFQTDHCGSCTRCIDACPTGCILPDRTLDATRCISYLTIELKRAIPVELRPLIGEWIFGCDICQMVCPWNLRFATPCGDPSFAPRPGVAQPDLVEEIVLSPEAYNRRFKDSPLKRARRRGYLRNVAVALGNVRVPNSVTALTAAVANDAEPLVRGHAAWALGQIGGSVALYNLYAALKAENDAWVQAEIKAAIQQIQKRSQAA
jgi:epoxyqueuosine reductase